MLLLNREDINRCADFPLLLQSLEVAHRGFVFSPPVVPQRSIITHPRQNAFSLFMPAWLPGSQALGIKVSSFHPGNSRFGLPSVIGAVLLIDVETGQLLAMLDSGTLTALRTSAMSALATDRLCPHNRLNLAIVGAGCQAAAHIRAMAAVRDIGWVRVYSRRYEQSAALAETLSGELLLPIAATATLDEALANADILCTTTSHDSEHPLIQIHQLKPSVHINAIGGSTLTACEIDPRILALTKVYVDHKPTAHSESGEISQALALSLIDEKDIHDMSALVDLTPLPRQKKGLSYFRSVGHASQDMVIASCLYAAAIEKGIGERCNDLSA